MKAFSKTYKIKARPATVLAALTQPDHVSAWSGSDASISAQEGATFSLWGGSIHGVNRKLGPDLLVQDWKEKGWEDFSTVTFRLTAKGDETEVELIHDGIPDKSLKSIRSGWDKYYMGPLSKYVEATFSDNPHFKPFMLRQGVTKARMFGWDCLKVNGNVFLTLTPDHLVLKLAATDIQRALTVAGSDFFEPTAGMPKMKEWVALPLAMSPELRALADAAYDYVAKLPAKISKKS